MFSTVKLNLITKCIKRLARSTLKTVYREKTNQKKKSLKKGQNIKYKGIYNKWMGSSTKPQKIAPHQTHLLTTTCNQIKLPFILLTLPSSSPIPQSLLLPLTHSLSFSLLLSFPSIPWPLCFPHSLLIHFSFSLFLHAKFLSSILS